MAFRIPVYLSKVVLIWLYLKSGFSCRTDVTIPMYGRTRLWIHIRKSLLS
jgi:hypothetical protein